MGQIKQSEWYEQWNLFRDEETLFLFENWIYPATLEDFRDKKVLEGGCGGGQQTTLIAPYAREIVAVDLNTIELAKQRNKKFSHVTFLEADISEMDLGQQFDIVFSVGVIHHTDYPEKAVENLKRHVKKGGRIILWVYAREGNFLVEHGVEPLRRLFFKNLSRKNLMGVAKLITCALYIPVYTLYLLPLPFLPYYQYFQNFRELSFYRNTLNVFDKLNAPQVDFICKERVVKWFDSHDFENIHISPYLGISWRVSARKRC